MQKLANSWNMSLFYHQSDATTVASENAPNGSSRFPGAAALRWPLVSREKRPINDALLLVGRTVVVVMVLRAMNRIFARSGLQIGRTASEHLAFCF